MSPVHSLSAPPFRFRRRNVLSASVGLFPECPEVVSSTHAVQGPAPVADQRGTFQIHDVGLPPDVRDPARKPKP